MQIPTSIPLYSVVGTSGSIQKTVQYTLSSDFGVDPLTLAPGITQENIFFGTKIWDDTTNSASNSFTTTITILQATDGGFVRFLIRMTNGTSWSANLVLFINLYFSQPYLVLPGLSNKSFQEERKNNPSNSCKPFLYKDQKSEYVELRNILLKKYKICIPHEVEEYEDHDVLSYNESNILEYSKKYKII